MEITLSVALTLIQFLFCRRKPGPQGQVRDNWLCLESCRNRERNDGILEDWNTGFSGMGSVFIRVARISL